MRTTARLGATVASLCLVLAGTGLVASPASAVSYDPVGVDSASSWIAGQTTGGLLTSGYDDAGTWREYPDAGLTIDAIESLVEAGRQPAAVQQMTDAVEDDPDYPTYGPGSKAKMLVAAAAAGRPLDTFAGGGLAAGVEADVSSASGSEGRLENAYGSVLSQAFAAHALTATGSGKAASVVDYLLRQQCTAGFFRESFSSGDDCVDASSTGSIDATATAVLQLRTVQDATVQTALTQARTWLAAQQQGNGAWLAFGQANANATGLAARALGEGEPSRQAAVWLHQHQVTDADAAPLNSDAGAVALDDLGYDNAQEFGIGDRDRAAFVRATAQALAAERWLPASSTGSLGLSASTSYLRAGSSTPFTVSGTKAGHVLTLTGPGTSQTGAATGTTWSRSVVLPAGTATRTYQVADDHGHTAGRSVKVLGARTLSVGRSKYRVHRSRYVTATLTGLAPGERGAIFYKGVLKRAGTASSAGVFKATFRVGRATGLKRIVGVGQFSDIRRGATTIRVVR